MVTIGEMYPMDPLTRQQFITTEEIPAGQDSALFPQGYYFFS